VGLQLEHLGLSALAGALCPPSSSGGSSSGWALAGPWRCEPELLFCSMSPSPPRMPILRPQLQGKQLAGRLAGTGRCQPCWYPRPWRGLTGSANELLVEFDHGRVLARAAAGRCLSSPSELAVARLRRLQEPLTPAAVGGGGG